MLERITIRNYALVDEATVEFGPGFNVLSGETGAGKSILIDALSLALGGKGKAEAIREGADQAEVVVVLRVSDSPELAEWSGKYDIEPEDGTLIIRRTLKFNGRGSASVQAVPVTRSALGELADTLVDIHGQHEHQSLFRIATHRKLLDRFAGLEERVGLFSASFTELADLGRQLEALEREEGQMAREADFLRLAVEEIDAEDFSEGEEEELTAKQKIMARSEEMAGDLEKALEASSESRGGALSQLRDTRENLGRAAGIDNSLDRMLKRFDEAFIEMEDLVQELRVKRDETEFNPEELSKVDDRLSRIVNLEKKYAVTDIRGLLEYAERARTRLEGFNSRDDERRRLSDLRDELQRRIIIEAGGISSERHKASEYLRERTELHLQALGMGDARFSVELEGRKNDAGKPVIGPYGSDQVEFLLSANRGESPRPLKSVASGGELSRVMLALKSVLSESDTVQTMIFDEVDTGIGGEVARSVGDHLKKLSDRKQVFCITHLASIAVFADNHLHVDKDSVDGRTVTRVRRVDGEFRVREVARMLAGDSDGTASLDHAAELLEERGFHLESPGAGA